MHSACASTNENASVVSSRLRFIVGRSVGKSSWDGQKPFIFMRSPSKRIFTFATARPRGELLHLHPVHPLHAIAAPFFAKLGLPSASLDERAVLRILQAKEGRSEQLLSQELKASKTKRSF